MEEERAGDDPVPVVRRSIYEGTPTIKEGDYVILSVNNGAAFQFTEIHKTAKVRVNKRYFSVQQLIGTPYGNKWEASRSSKSLVPHSEDLSSVLFNAADGQKPTADNRNLVDNNKSQALSQKQIEDMQETASGKSVVEALVRNSTTFSSKTEFSQAKYIMKKQQKHLHIVQILRPSSALLAEAYYTKGASTVNFLRSDSLACLLSQSDVRANTRSLVFENCKGLVIGSVVERMGGFGTIVNISDQQQSMLPQLKVFNFPPTTLDTIIEVPIAHIPKLMYMRQQSTNPASADKPNSYGVPDRVVEAFMAGFDSMVLVPKTDPSSLLNALLPFLKPSCSFSIFSPYLELLTELSVSLRGQMKVTHVQLAETWMREFQVLPQRTRPEMQMQGASGYVLSGIKLHESAQLAAGQFGGELDEEAPTSPFKKKAKVVEPTAAPPTE